MIPPAARPAHRLASGFSLIELLVALALLSLLSGALIQAVQFALRTERSTGARANDFDSVASTQQFLRRTVGTLYPYEPSTAENASAVIGTRESLEFTADAPQAAAVRGHYRYRIEVRHDGETRELIVRADLDRGGFIALPPRDRAEVLLSGFERVEFSYWQRTEDGTGLWSPAWTERHRAPDLVRLRVSFPAGDRRQFPELMVRTQIDADAQCEFDPVSRRCREIST
jgi:general secretion pathway protein J